MKPTLESLYIWSHGDVALAPLTFIVFNKGINIIGLQMENKFFAAFLLLLVLFSSRKFFPSMYSLFHMCI